MDDSTLGASLRERLRDLLGADIDPEVTLPNDSSTDMERPPSSGSSKILERLGSRGKQTDRYRLQGEIARGGMGVILEAWDEDLRRKLAMKVVLDKGRSERAKAQDVEPETLGRFLEEAQITGQLDHPGVVPVHELGLDDDGHVYFTMRLVRGSDLASVYRHAWAGEQGWSTTRVLGVLQRACEALSYAHAKGVIHRDLKPANVMVGRFGEVYVMDWGLARITRNEDGTLREDSLDMTKSSILSELRGSGKGSSAFETAQGQIFGTPQYMPPEQAWGESATLDERADVYAMGSMLYHLLAEEAPFARSVDGASAFDILMRVREGPPAPLTEVAPQTPPELVALVEKAMARESVDRYANMGELAEDLTAYLEGRVVRAHRTGALIEFRKWVGRNRGTAAALLLALLAALGGLASTSYVQAEANEDLEAQNIALGIARDEAADNATAANLSAEQARIEAESNRATVDFLSGMFDLGNPDRALGRLITVREVLEGAARDLDGRFEDEPAIRARMLSTLGDAFASLGLYPEGGELLAEAVEILRELEGADGPSTLEARLRLAELREDQGQSEVAAMLLGELLEGPGPLPEDAVESRSRARLALARMDYDRSSIDEVRDSMAEVLEDLRAAGLEDTPVGIEAEDLWARTGLPVSTMEEAVALQREIAERARSSLGLEHPVTARVRIHLADMLRSQGKHDESIGILRELVDTRRRSLGPEHPDTLASSEHLASSLGSAGRPLEALEILEEAAKKAREVLGERHHEVLRIENKRATLLKDVGRFDEARELFGETLERFVEGYGENHPGTGATLNNFGLLEQAMGNFSEAEELLERGLAARRSVYEEGRYEVLQTQNNLALVYRNQARYEEALELSKRTYEGYLSIFGLEHPETLTTLDNYAVIHYFLNRLEDAVPLYERLLETGAPAFGESHPVIARSRNNFGAVLTKLERWDEALEQFEAARTGYEESLGPHHPETLKTLGHMARIHRSAGDFEQAEALALECLEGNRATFGVEHPGTASAQSVLAGIYRDSGRQEEAEVLFADSAKRLADALGAEHPFTRVTELNHAEVLILLDRKDEARGILDSLEGAFANDPEGVEKMSHLRDLLDA